MQVNLNNNNPNFGECFIHKGLPINSKYVENSHIVDLSKEYLQSLAKDVDIHIFFRNFFNKGLDIVVGPIVESPFKRFLHMFGITEKRTVRYNVYSSNISQELNTKAKSAKENYNRFKDYNNA